MITRCALFVGGSRPCLAPVAARAGEKAGPFNAIVKTCEEDHGCAEVPLYSWMGAESAAPSFKLREL